MAKGKYSGLNTGYEEIYSDTSHKVNKKSFKRKKKHPVLRNIVIFMLSAVLACSGWLMIFYYNTLDSMVYNSLGNIGVPDDPDGSALNPVDTDSDSGNLLNDPMILNIMLFGSDTRSSTDSGRSDTMILLSLDNRHKKIKMTSFLRDLWVTVPGYGQDKLTHAYSYGGPSLSIKTIESNFGIKIDRYAIVDFSSFINIIDILGGIDIELSDFEIDYINMQLYDNRQSDTRYTLTDSAGIVHLNGQQALWHARNRDSALSDFDRTDRQRQVLNVIFSSIKDSSLSQLVEILSDVGPMITTNFKKSEITTLVKNALTYLKYDIEEYKLPTGDNYYNDRIDGMAVLVIGDWTQARTDLAEFVFESSVSSNDNSADTADNDGE
ncbi:MAG: LCP family protein [Acutalibacteraceae bacterium]